MIFGQSAAKFTNIAETVTVLLDYDNLTPSWIEPNEIMHESIVNKHREWIKIADHHASFSVMINLHKYPIPQAKFIEIYNYLNTDVYFYPHRDAGALKDSTGAKVKFHIESIEPFCLEEPWYDALNITFKSKDGIDFSQSLTGLLIDKDGDFLQNKAGDNLIVKPGFQFGEIEKQSEGDPDTGTSESA